MSEEFDVQLSELEVRLERLRSLYEQYFVGIEKMEPAVARKDVDRRFWELRKVKVRNTAKRFKFQTLIQRYNTLQQYWMKVCRQIENGTYVRHLARAKRRLEQANVAPPRPLDEVALSADEPSVDEVRAAFNELERSTQPPSSRSQSARPARRSLRPSEPAARPSATGLTSTNERNAALPPPRRQRAVPSLPPGRKNAAELTQVASPRPTRSLPPRAATSPSKSIAPRAQTERGEQGARPVAGDRAKAPPPRVGAEPPKLVRPAASAGQDSGLSEARIDRLYAELERARQNTGDQPISRPALAKSLRQMEQRLKAKHEGKEVDFRVEIQDGEARIKPVVKRGPGS